MESFLEDPLVLHAREEKKMEDELNQQQIVDLDGRASGEHRSMHKKSQI